MWRSPRAPLCSSLCSIQRDTPQFAYPVPSRCLLRARRLQHTVIHRASLSLYELLDEGRTLSTVFRWRTSAGSVALIASRGRHTRFLSFFSSSSTQFTQNVGRAFSARSPRTALLSRGRLTKGGSRLPFHLLLP